MGGFVGDAVGGVVGGLFGGNSAPSAPNVNVYQPTGTGNVDTQLQQLLTQNTNLVGNNNPYNTYSPQFAQLYSQIFGSPYQGSAQTAANTGGASYGQVGNQSLANSTALSSAIPGLLNNANTVANTAFDPQSALYNQTLQKVNDQANVANAQYGLTGQQAAGNVQQADTNFNIDWQNQELARQLSGLSGLGTAIGAAGTGGTAVQNIGSAGAGSQVQAGSIPYQQALTGTQNQSAALQEYIASLFGPQTSSESTIADLGSYLGQGIGASTSGSNAALSDYYAQLQGASSGAVGGAALGNNILNSGLFSFLNPSSTAAPAATSPLPWQQAGYGNAAGAAFYG